MRSRFGYLFLALAAVLAPGTLVLQAESGQARAAVLGYVFDEESGALRRIDGLPGASSIGAPIDLGVVLTQAAIAPSGAFAVARDEAGRFLTVDLRAAPPVAAPLEGALEGADRVLISPDGARAALYASGSGALQILEGLPNAPAVRGSLELGSEDWTAMAISDKGAILAASAGALHGFALDEARAWVRGVGRASGIAFVGGSNDAVVADAGADEVIFVRDALGLRESTVIASASDGLPKPDGVAVTPDGAFAVAAVAGGVATMPIAGGAPIVTACDCAPGGLSGLAGGNVFRLTDDLRAPVRIVEVGAAPRVLFIPALAESGAAD